LFSVISKNWERCLALLVLRDQEHRIETRREGKEKRGSSELNRPHNDDEGTTSRFCSSFMTSKNNMQ